jgi:hypothetical protein
VKQGVLRRIVLRNNAVRYVVYTREGKSILLDYAPENPVPYQYEPDNASRGAADAHRRLLLWDLYLRLRHRR